MGDDERRFGSRAKVANPYQFDETEPSLTSLKKWFNTTANYMKQNEEFLQFFDGDVHSEWIAKSADPTRGLIVLPRVGVDAVVANPAANPPVIGQPAVLEITADEATRKTRILRRDLDTLLNNYATYVPDGFFDMILEDCTSIDWIYDRLASSYRLESTKQYFLNSHLIRYTPEDGDTPEKLYIRLRAHYMAAAPKEGDSFDGRILQRNVRLNELSELMLVEKVLERVDPRLPAHVMKTRGHLMEDGQKTLFCIRRLLWNQLHAMILEMDNTEQITSMVTTRQVTAGHRRNGQAKPWKKNRGDKSSGFGKKSAGIRDKSARNRSENRSEKMCGACFRAGREEAVFSSHNIDTCGFLSKSDKSSLVRAVSDWAGAKGEDTEAADTEHEEDSSDEDTS